VDEVKDVSADAAPTVPADDGRVTRTGPRGQQVVEALRNEIIAGHFEPGQRLIEATLSQELGTSRGPVREALRQLENEGLVMSVPYKGAVVLGVSDEEVQEVLIPIRLVLERYSFAHAVRVMTDADFAELGKQIWVMERAARTGDLLKVVEADLRFHDIVCRRGPAAYDTDLADDRPRIRAYFFGTAFRSLDVMVAEPPRAPDVLQTGTSDRVREASMESHRRADAPADGPNEPPVSGEGGLPDPTREAREADPPGRGPRTASDARGFCARSTGSTSDQPGATSVSSASPGAASPSPRFRHAARRLSRSVAGLADPLRGP
jgi:DNA-binding GntR family transcriptional regulator